MYKVKRFSQDPESKKNGSNAGKGAALIGGIGLAGTGTAVGLAKKDMDKAVSNIHKIFKDEEAMARASSNIAKQVGKSKMIKRGSIGLAATGLTAGGYYLAKKSMDKNK